MNENNQRRWIGPVVIVTTALAAATICSLSYLADRSYIGSLTSIGQIDLLKENLADHWAAYDGLPATEVHFNRTENNVVTVDVLLNPRERHRDSDIRYALGFLAPGWYEFSGEFQAETDNTLGIGAQLEVASSHWKFITKSDPLPVERRKKFDVYFRPSDCAPGAEISLRFFGAGGNRSGRAFLRNIRLVKIAREPPPEALKFDVETMEIARLGLPPNPRYPSFRGLGVVVLLLVAVVGVCWRLLE